jgi:glycosyltransferase involved in cell wall biosynthesis
MKEKTNPTSDVTHNVMYGEESSHQNTKHKDSKDKQQKILFIITKSVFGGAGRYVYELATRLSTEGQQVAVALGGDGPLKHMLEEAGIQVFPISSAQRDMNITKEIKTLWRVYSILRTYKPTVVHLNSPKIGGLGALAARLAFVPKIIYTNHGWPFKESRPEWQLVLIRIFSWITVFLGGTTILLSKTELDYVKKWPFVQKKFVIIPNGVAHFTPKDKDEALTKLIGEDRAKEWKNENRTIIGTISELHKNKGLTYAIEGIQSYISHYPDKKVGFIIIGEGELRTDLTAQIKDKNIILAGHVNEAREYISAFDIFLLSSIKEGLPFAILEAGYVGVPVISTSVGGIPEVIQNLEQGMLIPPKRAQEIKNALVYLDEHPEVKDNMTKALRDRINEKYNFEKIIVQIKNIYHI